MGAGCATIRSMATSLSQFRAAITRAVGRQALGIDLSDAEAQRVASDPRLSEAYYENWLTSSAAPAGSSPNFAQWAFYFATEQGRRRLGIRISDDEALKIVGDRELLHGRYQEWVAVRRARAGAAAADPRSGLQAIGATPSTPSPQPRTVAPASLPTSHGNERPVGGPLTTPQPAGSTKQPVAYDPNVYAAARPVPDVPFRITGFVLGIISIFTCGWLWSGLITTILGIVFSSIALSKFPNGAKGRALPIWGLSLSLLYLLVTIGLAFRAP